MMRLSMALAHQHNAGKAYDHGIPTLRDYAAKALGELAVTTKGAVADFKMDEVELLPVIPDPEKILCIGLNYRKHAEETGSPIPTYPVVFTRFNNTLVPHKGKPMKIDVAMSNSFGFGGTNASVIFRKMG